MLWCSKFKQSVGFLLNLQLWEKSKTSFREILVFIYFHLLVIPVVISSINHPNPLNRNEISPASPRANQIQISPPHRGPFVFVCYAMNKLKPFPEETHMSCIKNWRYCGMMRVMHLHYVDSYAPKPWKICLEKRQKTKGKVL